MNILAWCHYCPGIERMSSIGGLSSEDNRRGGQLGRISKELPGNWTPHIRTSYSLKSSLIRTIKRSVSTPYQRSQMLADGTVWCPHPNLQEAAPPPQSRESLHRDITAFCELFICPLLTIEPLCFIPTRIRPTDLQYEYSRLRPDFKHV